MKTDTQNFRVGPPVDSEAGPCVRYVLHPGYVTSASDGQQHFIGGPRLALLYGLEIRDRLRVVFGDRAGYLELPGDVHLHPRNDGDYNLKREIQVVLQTVTTKG